MENFSDKFLFVRDRRFVQNPLSLLDDFARRSVSLLLWDGMLPLEKIRSSHECETVFFGCLCAVDLRGLLGKGFVRAEEACRGNGNRGGER